MRKLSPLFMIAISMAVIAIIGISYLRYFYIPNKAEESILWSISSLGFDSLSIGNIENKGGSLILSDISLDEKYFSSVREVTVEFGLFDYFFKHKAISKIIIDGVSLTAGIDNDNNLSISGFSSDGDFFNKLQSLKTKNIIIKNGSADVLTEQWGGISATYEGQITISDTMQFLGNVQTVQNLLSFSAKVKGEIDKNSSVKTDIDIQDLFIENDEASYRRGAGSIIIDYPAASSLDFRSSLTFPSGFFRKMPLRDIQYETENVGGVEKIKIQGKAGGSQNLQWALNTDKDGKYIVRIQPENVHDLVNYFVMTNIIEEPNIPFFVRELPITDIEITFTDLVSGIITIKTPALSEPIHGEFKSSNDAKNVVGSLKFNADSINFVENLDLDIAGLLAFTINTTKSPYPIEWNSKSEIENGSLFITSDIKLSDFSASLSHSSKKQSTSTFPLKFKLPLKSNINHSGSFNLQLSDTLKTNISGLVLNIFDGTVKPSTPLINNSAPTKGNKLIVADINIGKLFKSAGFSEIIAWGEIGGVLPMIIKDNDIHVKDGILQSQSSGIIKIPPYLIAGLFPGGSMKMRKIRATLQNYHYEFFELRMDGLLNDRVLMTLNSRGYNPDIKSDEPIDINLQIETQISLLFENMLKK